MVILGILLLLLAAVLFRPNRPMAEMGAPSFIKILGMTTNASAVRYCTISITNTTVGAMAFTPVVTLVATAAGWKTNLVNQANLDFQTGFNPIFSKGEVQTLVFPVPEGAVRWKLRFVMDAQTLKSRAGDAVQDTLRKAGFSHSGNWKTFGRHETFTTSDLPP